MFNINEELKKLPDKPGVYIMRDKSGKIIYIGKAKSLKNRVKSYFHQSHDDSLKTKALVVNIDHFEYILTDTEVEALILECTLIKKHRPHFNILLKDDKSFPFIKITMNEPYPRILMVRKVEKDGAKYYGPYTSSQAVRETIAMIKRIFPLRTCERNLPKDAGKERPCLNYHINQCMGVCIQDFVPIEEYNKMVSDVCSVIEGKYDIVEKDLVGKMLEASESLDFEKAAAFRDKLSSLRHATEKQKIVIPNADDQDVFAFARNNADACMQVFLVRQGRVTGRESFMLEGTLGSTDQELISGFLKQYYSVAQFIPSDIAVPADFEDRPVIEDWLGGIRGRKVHIIAPQRGIRRRMVEMVERNAAVALLRFNENKLKEETTARDSMEALKNALKMDQLAHRIEAFDISNTGESENVASMVVFTEGRPNKKHYRRYKIKTVEGANDYASMQEAVFRRLKRLATEEEIEGPDLILVDGGLGHMNAIKDVLDSMGFEIPVVGMVKDNRHRSRGLITPEGNEVVMENNLVLLRFITAIQNEAHRFAIEYNKKLRSRRYKTSILDNIEGIGDKRKKALISQLGSVQKIRNATVDQLCEVEGINRSTAERIRKYFDQYSKE